MNKLQLLFLSLTIIHNRISQKIPFRGFRGVERYKCAYLRIFVLSLLFYPILLSAQKTPAELKYSVMDLYALRYYPFSVEADSIVLEVINNSEQHKNNSSYYKKTSVNLNGNKDIINSFADHFSKTNSFLYKNLIHSYLSWLNYAEPLTERNEKEIALTIGFHEELKSENKIIESNNESIYRFLGNKNIENIVDDFLGDVDLFKKNNHIMMTSVKSPLNKKEMTSFRYFISSTKIIDEDETIEIVFYPKEEHKSAFVGYLYISKSHPYTLKKAVFTLNRLKETNLNRNILFTQHFESKNNLIQVSREESLLNLGDELKGSFQINKVIDYSSQKDFLSLSEKQIKNLVKTADETKAYRNLKTIGWLLLTDHYSPHGEKGIFELGPVSQMLSHNEQEGFRLKAGGNTTLQLNNRFLLGGYLAYGTKDETWKYRGDLIYSFLPKERTIWEYPKRLLRATYVHDLNVPGDNLLTSNRDFIFYSFSQSKMRDMSMQKLAVIDYEHEWNKDFSFKVAAQYSNENPVGRLEYISAERGKIEDLTSTELNFSLRYLPQSVFLQSRETRRYLQKGSLELNLNHHIGLKNVLGSDFRYHITEIDVYKKIPLSTDIGVLETEFSARKVWNQLPFPFLFVSGGNQSYVFRDWKYNLMNYSEFISDNYISGKFNFQFNWSPFHLFSQSKIKTDLGLKTLYGPLSDKNNPDNHPNLFILNNNTQALGNDPYVEMNIGFSNIFKFLRVEWVQRLTYLENDINGNKPRKGSIFVSAKFSL